MRPHTRLATALAVALLGPLLALPVGTAQAGTGRPIRYTSFDDAADLATGRTAGVRVLDGGVLRLDRPQATRTLAGTTYQAGRWTSPWTKPGFAFTELIPSWEARTPEGTLVEVAARARTADGRTSSWDLLGRWAEGDAAYRRRSQGAQTDDLARVATDTMIAAAGAGLTRFQLRVVLLRRAGTSLTPRVDAVGAVVSRIPPGTGVATSEPGVAAGTVLPVPRLSQMVHTGHLPEYGGGGAAWCSPTSLAMVLSYYDAQPSAEETAWVGRHRARVVDHLARATYDHRYRGTGNWPFNTAYAATRAGVEEAFVTRFAGLRGVERFVAAGIPVITSLAFGSGQLTGAPIGSSAGHLLVVVGFEADGDVVVNDPAADPRQDERIRRVYDRGEFEDAWLKRGAEGGSGGVAYVVRNAAHPLPDRKGATSW